MDVTTYNYSMTYETVWWTSKNQQWQVFQVQACKDAHILLSSAVGSVASGYEIGLGMDNMYSVIRKQPQGDDIVLEDTADFLSCTEFRTFWVSWSTGLVEVGQGSSAGEQMFMRLLDDDPPDNIIAVAVSSGVDSSGTWSQSSITGTYNIYNVCIGFVCISLHGCIIFFRTYIYN